MSSVFSMGKTYNTYISYKKPQSQMKDLNARVVLTEKNDTDNDIYRNATTKATQSADIDRYSQGTFDLSLLVAGRNADSYFSGKMSNAYDVDYFHVDTSSQMLSKRPVIVNMEMPQGADFDLTVYDDQGNQVGMAVQNEDGTKTLTIPCDWSNCRNFVIKINQHDSGESVEGNYKLTFSQGEMPKGTLEWMERMKNAKIMESPEERKRLGQESKEKSIAKNAEGIEQLHQSQYEGLSEELKYKGTLSVIELLEKEKAGETLSEAEQAYIAIYGNQNEIFQAESAKMKYSLEREFVNFLDKKGISDKNFIIHFTALRKAEISGLEGEEKKAVDDYVEEHWDAFKKVYLSTSDEIAEMTDQQYRLAGYVEECNHFLASVSGGSVSVADLRLDDNQTGKIVTGRKIEGLPVAVAQTINSAGSTDRFYDYQQMIYEILEYRKINGEIPEYHMNLGWNGVELKYR